MFLEYDGDADADGDVMVTRWMGWRWRRPTGLTVI